MFGSLRLARFAALSVLCLVAAATAAQAQNTPAAKIIGLNCSKVSFTTVTCMFTTNVPAQTVVATGTSKQVLVQTPDLRYRIRHSITVRGLAPNTKYLAVVSAKPKNGKMARIGVPFQTAAPGSAPATVTNRGKKLLLNGQPWFPLEGMTVLGCVDAQDINDPTRTIADDLVSIGSNVITGTSKYCAGDPASNSTLLHQVLDGRAWWNETSPEVLAELSGLPELISWQVNTPSEVDAASLIGCASKGSLGQYDLIKSKSGPVIAAIQLGAPPTPSTQICITPTGVTNLVYTSVAAGASGIGWITINPLNASTTDYSVAVGVADKAKELARQLATLDPVLLVGKTVPVSLSPKSGIKAMAWRYGGATYIITVNTQKAAVLENFSIPGTATAKTAQVLWETRRLKLSKGIMTDRFNPLEVHIYKIVPPPKK